MLLTYYNYIGLIISLVLIKSIESNDNQTQTHCPFFQASFDVYHSHIHTFVDFHLTADIFTPINTEIDYSWTTDPPRLNNKTDNQSNQQIDLNYPYLSGTFILKGTPYEGNLTIRGDSTSETMPYFLFYIINQKPNDLISFTALGLAYKFKDKRYSIIHQLKDNQVINKAAFGVIFRSDSSGNIYYGGLPIKETEDIDNAHCDLIQSNSNWSCELQGVLIGSISYSPIEIKYINEQRAEFTLSQEYIVAPQSFIDFLVQNYLYNEIKSGICVVNYLHSISCECYYTKDFLPITFVFQGTGYQIQGESLFEYSDDSVCEMAIVPNQKNHNENNKVDGHWQFGLAFIKQFSTEFNYDEQVMKFYSMNKVIELNSKKLFPIKRNKVLAYAIGILIGSILVIVSFIIFREYRRRKGKNMIDLITNDIYYGFK